MSSLKLMHAPTMSGLITDRDPEWPTATLAWNLSVDQHPAFVVRVDSAAEVAEVVSFARSNGLRVAPQGTGHNAAPLGDLTDTILLRTDRLREVTVDVPARTVRVGAGALWADVTAALAPHGLTALAGSSADVGVVGYTLGGGYSWLSRKYGLATSRVTAIEIVTGDGVFRRITDPEQDLFWAVFAMIDGAIDLPEVEAAQLLSPLRALGPAIDTFAPTPTSMLDRLHMDPPGPTPGIGDGFGLGRHVTGHHRRADGGRRPGLESALLAVDLRHVGGAVGRPDPRGGAIDHLPGRFLGFAVGVAPYPEAAAAVKRDLETVLAAIRPWRSTRDYPNFRESIAEAGSFYSPAALARLRELQATYNPDRVVRSNHEIG